MVTLLLLLFLTPRRQMHHLLSLPAPRTKNSHKGVIKKQTNRGYWCVCHYYACTIIQNQARRGIIVYTNCEKVYTKIQFLGGRGTRSCIRVHGSGVLALSSLNLPQKIRGRVSPFSSKLGFYWSDFDKQGPILKLRNSSNQNLRELSVRETPSTVRS